MGNDTEFEASFGEKWETIQIRGEFFWREKGNDTNTRYIIFIQKNEKNREKT